VVNHSVAVRAEWNQVPPRIDFIRAPLFGDGLNVVNFYEVPSDLAVGLFEI
jgi:hypothetical protein